MEKPSAKLRAAIEQFTIDDPGAVLSFDQRLARENGWSPGFSRRVVREYRRFLVLSATAGHPVTPSDEIDQAWHLHLTYTRSYWQRLCRDILGHPLHHEPTRGGAAEGAKFKDWYERTLASYRIAFGEEPPPDIWPPTRIRFGAAPTHQRVDRATHWILRRPRPGWPAPRWWKSIAALFLGTTAMGCTALYGTYPFTLDGQGFLPLFLLLAAVVFTAAGLLRSSMRASSPTDRPESESEDPYLLAYLAGGHARAVQSAVVALAARRSARTDASRGLFAGQPPGDEAHPLENAVYTTLSPDSPQTLRSVTVSTTGLGNILRNDLIQRGWWMSADASARARTRPLLLALLVPAIGILRSIQGITAGYSSEFIVILTLVTLVAALVIFARRPGRSRAGSAVLARLRARHADWSRPKTRSAALSRAGAGAGATATMLPLAVGLYGSSVLAGTELDHVRRTLAPADTSSSGCSSSSGCGAGGGGGDGGGGSSGCGGCGGGGGD